MTLPAPLVAPEVDLKTFPDMPLEVARLRQAGIVRKTTAVEFRCALLLWCASWHQVPAASLPNDDEDLADYAGFGFAVKEWKKIKAGAMRGWILCADGRFYHPVVAQKANAAWLSRLEYRWKRECDRIRQHNKRHHDNLAQPTFDEWNVARLSVDIPVTGPVSHADQPTLSDGQISAVTRTDPKNPVETGHKGREGKGRDIKHSGVDLPSQGVVDNSHPTPLGDKSPEGQNPRPPVQWWKSDDGIVLKASELQIPLGQRTFAQLKDLCFERIKAIGEGKVA